MVREIPTDAGHPATMEDPKDRVMRETAQKLHDERERRKFDRGAVARLTRENIALKRELDAERKRAALAETTVKMVRRGGCATRPGPYSGDSTQ